ncbi:MAG: BLUF domain-containing protein [Rhodopseudomonas palustris]|uniref:BLUF domain-containing protein n=1 Tax=Rhodopseudomonas palustris TaxID=1076 RepID=A0A933RXQ8_RHOPL|nr:BLUF domain-containing protein [Rhodopseudomonas palustris]
MPARPYRCVYWSRQRIDGTPEQVATEIESILTAARRNNAQLGITGALAVGRGIFAQLLEGPRQAVETAFENIQRDERHGDVQVLAFGPAEQRAFPGWPMAYVEPSQIGSQPAASTSTAAVGSTHLEARRLLDIIDSLAVEPQPRRD